MGPKFQSYGKDLPCDCWLGKSLRFREEDVLAWLDDLSGKRAA